MKVDTALNRTDVVLVIIGPAWMRLLNERLEDSTDWVRYEIAQSLKRSWLPVVPICSPGVDIPQPHQLPEDLKALGWRDGVILDPFQDFDSHLHGLLSDMDRVLESLREEREQLPIVRLKLVTLLGRRAYQLQEAERKEEEQLRLARLKLVILLGWRVRQMYETNQKEKEQLRLARLKLVSSLGWRAYQLQEAERKEEEQLRLARLKLVILLGWRARQMYEADQKEKDQLRLARLKLVSLLGWRATELQEAGQS